MERARTLGGSLVRCLLIYAGFGLPAHSLGLGRSASRSRRSTAVCWSIWYRARPCTRKRSRKIPNLRFASQRAPLTRRKIHSTVAATLQLNAAPVVPAPLSPIWVILIASDERIPGSRHISVKVIPNPAEDTATARHHRWNKMPRSHPVAEKVNPSTAEDTKGVQQNQALLRLHSGRRLNSAIPS